MKESGFYLSKSFINYETAKRYCLDRIEKEGFKRNWEESHFEKFCFDNTCLRFILNDIQLQVSIVNGIKKGWVVDLNFSYLVDFCYTDRFGNFINEGEWNR